MQVEYLLQIEDDNEYQQSHICFDEAVCIQV